VGGDGAAVCARTRSPVASDTTAASELGRWCSVRTLPTLRIASICLRAGYCGAQVRPPPAAAAPLSSRLRAYSWFLRGLSRTLLGTCWSIIAVRILLQLRTAWLRTQRVVAVRHTSVGFPVRLGGTSRPSRLARTPPAADGWHALGVCIGR